MGFSKIKYMSINAGQQSYFDLSIEKAKIFKHMKRLSDESLPNTDPVKCILSADFWGLQAQMESECIDKTIECGSNSIKTQIYKVSDSKSRVYILKWDNYKAMGWAIWFQSEITSKRKALLLCVTEDVYMCLLMNSENAIINDRIATMPVCFIQEWEECCLIDYGNFVYTANLRIDEKNSFESKTRFVLSIKIKDFAGKLHFHTEAP